MILFQRASIALHTQLYFRKQGAKEETAYIMQVKQNAISVLITQFGMEGLIFFNELESEVVLDEETCSVTVKGKSSRLFLYFNGNHKSLLIMVFKLVFSQQYIDLNGR